MLWEPFILSASRAQLFPQGTLPVALFLRAGCLHHIAGFRWVCRYGYRESGGWIVGALDMEKPTFRRATVNDHRSIRIDAEVGVRSFDAAFEVAAGVGRTVSSRRSRWDRSAVSLQSGDWRGVWSYTVRACLPDGHWYEPLFGPVNDLLEPLDLLFPFRW